MPFRKLTANCLITVSATPSQANLYTVPTDLRTKLDDGTYTQFMVVNSNACYVRLVGSRAAAASGATLAAEGLGHLFAPAPGQ